MDQYEDAVLIREALYNTFSAETLEIWGIHSGFRKGFLGQSKTARRELLAAPISLPAGMGSFDSVTASLRDAVTALRMTGHVKRSLAEIGATDTVTRNAFWKTTQQKG